MDKWHWAIVGGAVGVGLLLYAASPAHSGEMTDKVCGMQTHLDEADCNRNLDALVEQLAADEAPPKLSHACSDHVIAGTHAAMWSGLPPQQVALVGMAIMDQCKPGVKPTEFRT